MINSLIELKEPLLRAMEDATGSKTLTLRITDVEWDMLEQLQDTLIKPLLAVTELLGGDKYVTRSVLIPALKLLKNAMTTNDCDPAFICRFKAMLVDSVEERLLAWPHYSDYEVATSLDPRFKSLACIERDRREHVWERLSQLAIKPSATPTDNNPSKKRKYHFLAESEGQSTPCLVSLYRSMAEVADNDLDPLEWWRVQSFLLPGLAPVAKMLLCVLVTSTPCESVFSTAGMTVNKQRNSAA